RHVDRAPAIDAHRIGSPARPIFDFGDVAEIDHFAAIRPQRYLLEILGRAHHAVRADIVSLRTDAHLASGNDLTLVVDDARHVHGRQLQSFESPRMDVDLHLPKYAAKDRRGSEAFDPGQLVTELVIGQVEEIFT